MTISNTSLKHFSIHGDSAYLNDIFLSRWSNRITFIIPFLGALPFVYGALNSAKAKYDPLITTLGCAAVALWGVAGAVLVAFSSYRVAFKSTQVEFVYRFLMFRYERKYYFKDIDAVAVKTKKHRSAVKYVIYLLLNKTAREIKLNVYNEKTYADEVASEVAAITGARLCWCDA